MADTAIMDLTPETVMTAAHEFVVQDTSAATLAQAATFALMGGLEIDSTYNTAADHADISAAAGKLYLVNMSALASDMNFTLPVAANVNTGERVGVHITTGDDTYEMDLKSGAAGDLINGTDHSSTSWSRLFITGETVIFQCINGTTGDWAVVNDGRIPCQCEMGISAAKTTGGSAWVVIQIAFNTTSRDIGDLADTSSNHALTRRAGNYIATCFCGPYNAIGDTASMSTFVYVNGAAVAVQKARLGDASEYGSYTASTCLQVAAGIEIEGWYESGTANTGHDANVTLKVIEVL